jgi:hypothetical protein
MAVRAGRGGSRSWRNLSAAARFIRHARRRSSARRNSPMNGIIYLIGLIVVIMAILSFFGLR